MPMTKKKIFIKIFLKKTKKPCWIRELKNDENFFIRPIIK